MFNKFIQIVSKSLAEFFDAPRDDLILNVQIQRDDLRPILNIQLEKFKARKTRRRRKPNTLTLYDDETLDKVVECKKKHMHDNNCSSTKSLTSTVRLLIFNQKLLK